MAVRPPAPDLSALKIEEHARLRTGSRWLRWIAAAIGVGFLALALGFVLIGRNPQVQLATAHSTSGETRVALLNASGYVTPRRRATVAAKITGRVVKMYAEEGMQVEEGQVLAVLDESDARTRLLSAQADRDATSAALADLRVNLGNAERELRRTEGLEQAGVASPQALDLARTTADSFRARIKSTDEQVRAAEARIRVAQQDLDNCIVRAPFAGIVVSKDAQVGEMVSPVSAGGGFTRTGIATIVDMNSNEVEVDVNESYIARVQPGQPVTSVLDAYPDWKIPSHVRTVIPTADRQKATVKVRISFDRLDPRILPDMGVKVTFLGEETGAARAATRVLVPHDAVRQENGQTVVFLYREGKVERRAVRVGGAQGNDVEIIAGVGDGDRLAIGAEPLKDGQRVDVKQ